MPAPYASRRPVNRTHHGDTFVDPYEWLRDKSDPDVIAYLDAENAWTQTQTADQADLAQELFDDIKARTQETDLSVPTYHRHEASPAAGGNTNAPAASEAWWYYTRTVEGRDYPIHCRVRATDRGALPDLTGEIVGEQVLLDGNLEAEGHEFFSLGALSTSPDGTLLAYSVDHSGDERYDLRVRRVEDSTVVSGPLTGISSGVAWAGNDHLFYSRVDEAWRPHQVWHHVLGTDPANDVLVVQEDDEMFWLGAHESRDRRWILIQSGSKLTTEVRLVPAGAPSTPPRVVAPRRTGLEYSVEIAGDELYILHDANSPDFEVARAPLARASTPAGDAAGATAGDPAAAGDDSSPIAPESVWTGFLPPAEGVRYTDVEAYENHVVVSRRSEGLTGIEWHDRRTGESRLLNLPGAVHTVGTMGDDDYATSRIRIAHTSLVSPNAVLDLDLETGTTTVLKTRPVLDHPQHGPFRAQDYVEERLWATADDGSRVPISVVRRVDTPLDGTAPALLYGYGSYEICIDPTFSTMRLSLLDRGFVYAIAHVRGGGEMGRAWYDQGKALAKKHTFTDFISSAQHLIDEGYTSSDRLAAQGGSAGGLLMGAVANMAPETFRAIHAAVPFVDALTTILDPDLPLTVTEWEEWGDPLHDPLVYAYMRTYSPYENVRAQAYPAILATTSLNDTRVFYVEPAKWVAALRETALNTADRPILLRCEMVAGHGGVTGRYNSWREAAFEYAWIIDQVDSSRR